MLQTLPAHRGAPLASRQAAASLLMKIRRTGLSPSGRLRSRVPLILGRVVATSSERGAHLRTPAHAAGKPLRTPAHAAAKPSRTPAHAAAKPPRAPATSVGARTGRHREQLPRLAAGR